MSVALLSLWLVAAAAAPGADEARADEGGADPSASAASPRLFVFGIRGDGVEARVTRVLEGRVAEAAERAGYDAASINDVRALLDVEAARQAAGCDDDLSCLAELSGSLGAGLVVTGQAVQIGSRITLSLSLFDPQSARVVARSRADVDDETELLDAITPAAERLLADHRLVPLAAPTPASNSLWLWGAGAAGVAVGTAVAAIGTAPLVLSLLAESDAQAQSARYADEGSDDALLALGLAHDRYEEARSAWSTWGFVAAAAGAVVVVAGVSCLSAAAASDF